LLASVFLVAFTACASEPSSSAQPGRPVAHPVLLELFTSQGCSSCPPADALLRSVGHAGAIAGVPVIPLAFHVDYWNRLGWTDPFSSPRWSARQRRYARQVAAGRVYTPQLVVNGRAHVVGSDRRGIAGLVKRQAARGGALVVRAKLDVARSRARVRVHVPRLDKKHHFELVVALYESGLRTRVPRGENAGRQLFDDYVVRDLRAGPAAHDNTVVFALDRTWRTSKLGAVAWLRDARSQAVMGVVRAVR